MSPKLNGITFAKQFPNPAEPLRGLFVAEQVAATSSEVDWSVISAVPWIPKVLAGPLGRPFIKGSERRDGVEVAHPRYPVLPKRMLYTTVAPAVATAARADFERFARGADFVHAHALYPSAAAARRLAGPAGLPLIVSIHGSDLYTNAARPAWKRELEEVARDAAAIVCVSASLARDAVRLIGASPEKVCVIPDTYDEARFSLVERDAPDGRSLRLVTVGRLVPVKGFDVLLSALATAVESGLDAELAIVGQGPERSRLQERSVALGIAGRVRFTGALAPEDLASELARADLYLQPSRAEGFGVALVEAMATGLPAIATDVGGPADIVEPSLGELVAGDDAAALAGALARGRDLVAAADSRAIAASIARRFGRAGVASRLVGLYRAVVAGAAVPDSLAINRSGA